MPQLRGEGGAGRLRPIAVVQHVEWIVLIAASIVGGVGDGSPDRPCSRWMTSGYIRRKAARARLNRASVACVERPRHSATSGTESPSRCRSVSAARWVR